MSTQCTAWAYRCRVGNATAKAVLLYLADRASDDGTGAWPSVATISQVTEYCERSVRSALAYLEEHGFIRRGDQRHAALASKGRTRPKQYRSVVWDLAVEINPENLSAWLDRTHRDETHMDEGRVIVTNPKPGDADPDDQDDGDSVDSRGAGDAPLDDGQGCRRCTSRGAGDAPLLKPSVNHQLPPHGSPVREPRAQQAKSHPATPHPASTTPPSGDGKPDASSPAGLLDALDALLAARNLPRPAQRSARQLKAAKTLLAAHRPQEITAVAAWALDDEFWRSNVLDAVHLLRNWTQICLQMARPGKQHPDRGKPRPITTEDPDVPVSVLCSVGHGLVYGMARLRVDQAQAHLDGTLPTERCEACLLDTRNRSLHGYKAESQQEAPQEPAPQEPKTRRTYHFVGLTQETQGGTSS